MAKLQGRLPIINPRTGKIHGIYTLRYEYDFVGTETTFNLTSGEDPNSGYNMVNVQKIQPNTATGAPGKRVNDWYMAAVFTDEEFRLGVHREKEGYSSVNESAPSDFVSSPAGHANHRQHTDGAILQGLVNSYQTGVGVYIPA